MNKLAILLIVFGSGLAAFGISGFKGFFNGYEVGVYGGSFGWSLNNQIEIVCGVVSLIYGVILRKDSK
jgi:uncharacterized membrane protein